MAEHIHQLRAALIGLGFIGHVHLDALRRIGVTVAGVLDVDVEQAKAHAERLAIPRVYRSLDELASDETIDVVHVVTPNHLHAQHALAMLRAGKSVVCEKPLAMTSAEGEQMVRLAAERGAVAACCFHSRFYPMTAHAKHLISSGDAGDVRLVMGDYLQDWLALETDWNWRLDPALGGTSRAVGDIGSHWLDLVQHVTGRRVEEVFADLATFIPVRRQPIGPVQTFASASGPSRDVEIATEDAALVLLRFEGGALGQLAVSQVSPGRNNVQRFEISGSSCSLAWESEHPEDMWIGRRGAPNELVQRDPGVVAPEAAGWLPGGHPEGLPDAFAAMLRAVYLDVLAGGPVPRPQYATFRDGLNILAIEEAIIASARAGAWTRVPVPGERSDLAAPTTVAGDAAPKTFETKASVK